MNKNIKDKKNTHLPFHNQGGKRSTAVAVSSTELVTYNFSPVGKIPALPSGTGEV
jgi:hypothetical protein